MDALTLDHVMDLARMRGGVRLSLYMPTSRFGPGSQEEDVRRLRNHLRVAEESLAREGMRAPDVDRLLAQARALIDDRPFWLRARYGLALFAGPEGTVVHQLAEEVPDIVKVGARYHLKPLIGLLGADREFWLLALSQKHVRLLRGSRTGAEEVPSDRIPQSLGDALQWDDYEKRSLQFHSGTSGSGGRRPAVFHGTGEADVKDEIVRYFRGIDRGIHDLVKDSTAPLVLAGVEYLLPLYREVNTYPHLVGAGVSGSPDSLGEAELHARAWAIVDGIIAAGRAAAVARVEESWASSMTTPDLVSIVPAAVHGRVDALFVSEDAGWWGSYDPDTDRAIVSASPAPDDEDLLDLAMLHTLLNSGEVHSLAADEMPHGEDVVALLRY